MTRYKKVKRTKSVKHSHERTDINEDVSLRSLPNSIGNDHNKVRGFKERHS